jgi:hypothetical protein
VDFKNLLGLKCRRFQIKKKKEEKIKKGDCIFMMNLPLSSSGKGK